MIRKFSMNNEMERKDGITAAIAGTLIILIAARLAHELFYSPFLTAIIEP